MTLAIYISLIVVMALSDLLYGRMSDRNLKSVKGDLQNQITAMFRRLEDGDKKVATMEKALVGLDKQIQKKAEELEEKITSLKELADESYASADVIDRVHDEIFSVKTAVEQLGQKKKKKLRKFKRKSNGSARTSKGL